MWGGTRRGGLSRPGRTEAERGRVGETAGRSSRSRWQRLYLRPLPHQQGSFACNMTATSLRRHPFHGLQRTTPTVSWAQPSTVVVVVDGGVLAGGVLAG